MVRSFVLGVYGMILLLILLDLGRDLVGNPAFLPFYAPLTTLLGVLQAILLLMAAESVYLEPSITPRMFLKELAKHRNHLAIFVVFVALAAGAAAYNALASPYAATSATDFAGNVVLSVTLDPRLIALVFILLFIFLVYPTALLILGASKLANERVRNSIFALSAGWSVVTVLYVLVATMLWVYKFDAMGLMYLGNAVIFFVIIRNFRLSVALAGFVQPKEVRRGETMEPPHGTTTLTSSLAGKKVLYEVDPSVPYETMLGQTLEELAWAEHAIFVFTPKGSPLHRALMGGTGVKFFLTTPTVSRVTVSDETGEALIPQSDAAIFLDAADKALASRRGNVAFVFDNLSDLLLLIGLEKTYKFLKQFLELLHEPRATAFMLMIRGAGESHEANLLRGIFPSHFVEDAAGARLVK